MGIGSSNSFTKGAPMVAALETSTMMLIAVDF
jgi:hypothetical protein